MRRFFYLILFLLIVTCSSQKKEAQVEVFAENLYGGTGGLSVDKDGNVYSSDFGPYLGPINDYVPRCKVFKITPQGGVTVFTDSIIGASGSEFDSKGNLYQSNIRRNYISKISPEGKKQLFVRDSIVFPVGIAIDKDDNLVVCNCGNNSLVRVSPEAKPSAFVHSPLLNCPNGITLDEEGNFYVSNFNDGKIVKVTRAGEASILADIPGNNNGHVTFHNGNLYVVARAVHQVYKVSLSGAVELFAGSGKRGRRGGDRLNASFSYPNDLDFSPDGKFLYVNEEADTLSDERILTPTVVRRIRMDD